MNGTVSKRAKPKNSGGSRKGIPNKATQSAREAIARFVDGNADRLQDWLDKIAQEDGPAAAFRCFGDLLEYHVPKLSRSEVSGVNGGPIELTTTDVKVIDAEIAALLTKNPELRKLIK